VRRARKHDATDDAIVPIVTGESLDAWFARYLQASARGALAGFLWGKWLSPLVGSRLAGTFTPDEMQALHRTVLDRAGEGRDAPRVWAVLCSAVKAIDLATRAKAKPSAPRSKRPGKAAKANKPKPARVVERDPVDEAVRFERLKSAWFYE
jgi:hypothetical protein